MEARVLCGSHWSIWKQGGVVLLLGGNLPPYPSVIHPTLRGHSNFFLSNGAQLTVARCSLSSWSVWSASSLVRFPCPRLPLRARHSLRVSLHSFWPSLFCILTHSLARSGLTACQLHHTPSSQSTNITFIHRSWYTGAHSEGLVIRCRTGRLIYHSPGTQSLDIKILNHPHHVDHPSDIEPKHSPSAVRSHILRSHAGLQDAGQHVIIHSLTLSNSCSLRFSAVDLTETTSQEYLDTTTEKPEETEGFTGSAECFGNRIRQQPNPDSLRP